MYLEGIEKTCRERASDKRQSEDSGRLLVVAEKKPHVPGPKAAPKSKGI